MFQSQIIIKYLHSACFFCFAYLHFIVGETPVKPEIDSRRLWKPGIEATSILAAKRWNVHDSYGPRYQKETKFMARNDSYGCQMMSPHLWFMMVCDKLMCNQLSWLWPSTFEIFPWTIEI